MSNISTIDAEEAKAVLAADASARSGTPTPPEAQPPVKPEGVPDKFWKDGKVDTESLLKSYTELEKKTSKPEPKPEGEKPAETPEAQAAASGIPPEAFDRYTAEYAAGGLSEESYAELGTKYGIPKQIVDNYVAGLKLQEEAAVGKVYGLVGGKDQYTAMTEWAKSNLSKAEATAYDALVQSGDEGQVSLAVQGLHAKYQASGVPPVAPLKGAQNSGSGEQPFLSSAEVVRAMSDKRYHTDAAYREQVERRLAISPL